MGLGRPWELGLCPPSLWPNGPNVPDGRMVPKVELGGCMGLLPGSWLVALALPWHCHQPPGCMVRRCVDACVCVCLGVNGLQRVGCVDERCVGECLCVCVTGKLFCFVSLRVLASVCVGPFRNVSGVCHRMSESVPVRACLSQRVRFLCLSGMSGPCAASTRLHLR